MQIDEVFVDSQAPNAAAIKNARGVVIKRKLVGLFRSADGSGSGPQGSGAGNGQSRLASNTTAVRSTPDTPSTIA